MRVVSIFLFCSWQDSEKEYFPRCQTVPLRPFGKKKLSQTNVANTGTKYLHSAVFGSKSSVSTFKRLQVAGETDRQRKWEHRWYPALRVIERRCVCAHSWKPQLLLAGCPPAPVSSPGSTCLCLGFLSFSLPLQIFSNATEECSNVVEVVSNEQDRCFFISADTSWRGCAQPKPASPPNPTDGDQTFEWGVTIFVIIEHTHVTNARLHSSVNVNKCHDLFQ